MWVLRRIVSSQARDVDRRSVRSTGGPDQGVLYEVLSVGVVAGQSAGQEDQDVELRKDVLLEWVLTRIGGGTPRGPAARVALFLRARNRGD